MSYLTLSLIHICVENGVITINNTPNTGAHLVFEQAKPYVSAYATPFGILDVQIYPTLVNAKVCESAGQIALEYIVDMLGTQIVSRLDLRYGADIDQ